MKYKVGDKVRIVKSLTNPMDSLRRQCWLGKIMTIDRIGVNCYHMKEDRNFWIWTDDMIAGKAEEGRSSEYYLFKYLSAKLSEKEAELNAKLSEIKKIQEEIKKVLDNES